MEYFIYYVIMAVSFGLMYTMSYGIHIAKIVLLNLESRGLGPEAWEPKIYIFSCFTISTLFMPLFLLLILTVKPTEVIEYAANQVVEKRF